MSDRSNAPYPRQRRNGARVWSAPRPQHHAEEYEEYDESANDYAQRRAIRGRERGPRSMRQNIPDVERSHHWSAQANMRVAPRRDPHEVEPLMGSSRREQSQSQEPDLPTDPTNVRFVTDAGANYVVLDLLTQDEQYVPKRRHAADIFPPTRDKPLRGSGVLRLSGYALAGAVLGGIVGIALGAVVLALCLGKLATFERRARLWRKRQERTDDRRNQRRLPPEATSERLRLLTALGQALLAIAIATAEIALVTAWLR